MQLAEIVDTSAAVTATRQRRRKTALIAAVLRRLGGAEIAIGTANLCGELPQGRIVVSPAAVRSDRSDEPAAQADTIETVRGLYAAQLAAGG